MKDTIRWGILSTGKIAGSFAADFQYVDGAELAAVGSRSLSKARRFAAAHKISKYYGSYEELAADPEVDIIYIATPHIFHFDNARLCLNAGKGVLCEKSFTINSVEAESLIEMARNNRLFLMEAMWTRFQPIMVKLRQLITEGFIGELQQLEANIGFKPRFNRKSRLFDLALGGGALLDIGIYAVSLASMLFGKPLKISSTVHIGKTGADEQENILLEYTQNRTANLFASIRTAVAGEAIITGSRGRIRLQGPLYRPAGFTLSVLGEKDSVFEAPLKGNGLHYQVLEIMRSLRENEIENTIMPLNESLQIMQTMDELRKQWGLRYPGEHKSD